MRKDPTEFRERFKKWQSGEKVYEAGLPKYEDGYESFLATLPDNQKKPGAYNTRRYWELNGKPKNFAEAIGQGMYTFEKDNAWHANSVPYNDKNDTYEFMKPNYHETRWMELVYGYDKDPEFLKEWKVKYNGPMLSDRYVRREKPGLKVKGGLLPKFEIGTPWGSDQQNAAQEWGQNWQERMLPAAKSKVVQKWNATGKKPEPESSEEYTKRRVAEETKRTWLSDAADIAQGVKEGALSMSPYTAVPYFGAKVGLDILNGNVGAGTALDATFAITPFVPNFKLPEPITDAITSAGQHIYRPIRNIIRRLNRDYGHFILHKNGERPASANAYIDAMDDVGRKVQKNVESNYKTTEENAASITSKVNWDADNWFKTISGRSSYSSEEAAELSSHIPEYRAIEQRLFNEGKLTYDSDGSIVVKGSDMSPQEYIMRQSKAFQKMNPEHHYVGVSKGLRQNFENEARDPNTINRYEVWTDRKSPKNVEEYAQSRQGGYTNDSQIETIEHQMAIREENFALHKEQLKWKLDHGKISQESYDRDLAALKDMYNWKQKVAEDELKVLKQQNALDPLNGGKVFDVTYPKETVETPIINAENNHWTGIPFDNVVRDAPGVVTHYKQRPYSNELQTDQIVSAARRNGYGVTHIDNVMDTYNGTTLNETIIGRSTPIKSVLGNTGNFDIESPNKWKLYRSLLPPFLSLGTLGAMRFLKNKEYRQ